MTLRSSRHTLPSCLLNPRSQDAQASLLYTRGPSACFFAIPVVMLTSSREERDLLESYKLGANAYIQKPVEYDSFRQAVKQLGLFWLVVNEPPPPSAFQ